MRYGLVLLLLGAGCAASARARVAPDAELEELPDASVPADLGYTGSGLEGGARDAAPDRRAIGQADAPMALRPPDASAGDAAAPGTDAAPFTPPLVIAVGNDGKRMVSWDGKVWMWGLREAMGNRDGPLNLLAVAYGRGRVVAVGGGCIPTCVGRIVTTTDGLTWQEVDAPMAGRLTAVTYGNGTWVAVGSMPPVLHSMNGAETWTPSAKVAVPAGLRAVAHGRVGTQPLFVAVGDGYTRVTSRDGITWNNLVASDGSTGAFQSVAIGNGVVVAAGGRPESGTVDSGRLIRSLDGVTWSDELIVGPEIPNVVFADGKFFAFSGAGDNLLLISADGKEWLHQGSNGAGSNVAVGHLGATRLFVSRISPSTIKISTDGYTWGPTAAMSMPGDAILNAFTITGP